MQTLRVLPNTKAPAIQIPEISSELNIFSIHS